jgi:hypothetical protein
MHVVEVRGYLKVGDALTLEDVYGASWLFTAVREFAQSVADYHRQVASDPEHYTASSSVGYCRFDHSICWGIGYRTEDCGDNHQHFLAGRECVRKVAAPHNSVVWRITLAVVSRISCGFRAWTYSASMVRSTISAPVRVMLSRVDFFEASICIDSVLEMASKVPQKRLINA